MAWGSNFCYSETFCGLPSAYRTLTEGKNSIDKFYTMTRVRKSDVSLLFVEMMGFLTSDIICNTAAIVKKGFHLRLSDLRRLDLRLGLQELILP